ncbi:TetR/AcrR family transcriptional regulator [Rhodococcus sp. F64268]|uniref:TetR/AcrR family transcriptional regulator n=1 Tax=Rhodococcus sp. F64268 TaxID=2926402 RepID=UPI001FF16E51|nr:TetR/AcrR family transcriptional regulator [Rhodococcus sp. F64268]MCK0091770.1 TetR/AcrR family transcriptional regulator [Rhodococcus sp. F64268]
MSLDAEPRRQRLEPDARRRQILDCAIRLFGERPYASVSATELAKEAGVARGLINHYFGGKRDLYLEVIKAMVTVPPPDRVTVPDGTLAERADAFIDWFLTILERHGKTWLVAVAGGGMASDPDVGKILSDADDLAADRLLEALGPTITEEESLALHPMIRAYGGLIKSTGREWIERRSLTREQVHTLLTDTLVVIVESTTSASRSPRGHRRTHTVD